tara:strand:- start:440 stop:802 length:363 start_codon:yes stop_codon:yes gene_type:complete
VKFRSKFEKSVYEALGKLKKSVDYEPQDAVIRYVTPSRYIPDFRLPNGIYIECKGYFDARARGKMRRVRKDNPSLDIRFVFQRANNRITKSKNSMMYWEWAERHGFPWAEGTIPQEWFDE